MSEPDGSDGPPEPLPRRSDVFAARVSRWMGRAMAPPMRRPGGVDIFGFSSLRGMGRSGTAIVVLGVAFVGFILLLRFVRFLGLWTVVAVAWIGILYVLHRDWDRIRWGRLNLLFTKRSSDAAAPPPP